MSSLKRFIPVPVKRFVKDVISAARRMRKPVPIRKRFQVGRCTYGEPTVLDWKEGASLRIGAFCSIAADVNILIGGDHRMDWITTFPFPVYRQSAAGVKDYSVSKGDVVIGNDVWIGQFATILSGVTIGNGAVIGACSVVTKNVPAYAVVAGNPAKLIRMRFTDEEIAQLERIGWWDWPDEKIDEAMPLLLSGNVAGLAAFHLNTSKSGNRTP